MAMNVGDRERTVLSEVDGRSEAWEGLMGTDCEAASPAPASYAVTIPPMGFVLCKAAW